MIFCSTFLYPCRFYSRSIIFLEVWRQIRRTKHFSCISIPSSWHHILHEAPRRRHLLLINVQSLTSVSSSTPVSSCRHQALHQPNLLVRQMHIPINRPTIEVLRRIFQRCHFKISSTMAIARVAVHETNEKPSRAPPRDDQFCHRVRIDSFNVAQQDCALLGERVKSAYLPVSITGIITREA